MNALVVAALLASASTPPVEAPYPLDAVVRRYGESFVAGKPYLATVIAISTPAGRRVWGFGGIERDGQRVAPDGDTLYEIGSITKTFTGTLLADLADEGKVSLDDPVRKYLPEDWSIPRRDGREITLLQLATHSSSLPRMPPGFLTHTVLTLSVNDPYSEYRANDLAYALGQIELEQPIGSQVAYSNLGVGLLGFALARADGRSNIDELFDSRLLTPLGLDDTTFTLSDEQRTRLAPPFSETGWPANTWHFDCLKACGGLRSTADDLLTYAEAVFAGGDAPLQPAFQLAMQPFRPTCEAERAIGLGWIVQPLRVPRGQPECRLIWHNGGTGGYAAFLGLLPERRSAIVVLSNSTGAVDPVLTKPVVTALLRELR